MRSSFLRHSQRVATQLSLVSALFFAPLAHADLLVPAGGVTQLNGGSLDLGCTDVIVGGTLDLGGGTLSNVRNVSIQAGGTISAGAGSITLSGDWSNQGAFNAGTGIVSFVDAPACATTSTISGNSTFNRLSIVSTTGKLYRFAAGSSQRVQGLLTLTGTGSNPLRIESTVAGSSADINLSGTQNMANLAVRDMTASGEWLALGLTNQASGGAAVRWFGFPSIPVNSTLMLLLSALALLLSGMKLSAARARR